MLFALFRKTTVLVLLTDEETFTINKINRSKITKDRIADAGIDFPLRLNEIQTQ